MDADVIQAFSAPPEKCGGQDSNLRTPTGQGIFNEARSRSLREPPSLPCGREAGYLSPAPLALRIGHPSYSVRSWSEGKLARAWPLGHPRTC